MAPHRSWLDPVMMAITVYPQPLVLMAKQGLFKPKPFGWFIKKQCSVNREKPGQSAIKYPVQQIKENKKPLLSSLLEHDTQTDERWSSHDCSFSKSPYRSMVYQGPLTFKDIIKRKKKCMCRWRPNLYRRPKN